MKLLSKKREREENYFESLSRLECTRIPFDVFYCFTRGTTYEMEINEELFRENNGKFWIFKKNPNGHSFEKISNKILTVIFKIKIFKN